MTISLKRVYDPATPEDGVRVLVDRLWPRGMKKEALGATWLKDVAPSNVLRRWFHEHPRQWSIFRKRYLAELAAPEAIEALESLYDLAESSPVLTLLYASQNTERNNATVLKELLEGTRKPPVTTGPVRGASVKRSARARR